MLLARVFLLAIVVNTLSGPDSHDVTGNNTERLLVKDHNQDVNDPTCTDLWFTKGTNDSCVCGDEVHGAVYCNSFTKHVAVLDCYCMTNESTTHQMVVGKCIYNCVNMSKGTEYLDLFYHPAPSECKYLHRKGTLCGSCDNENHYYYPAYSYEVECVKCIEPHSWWLYFAEAFLPLTMFIILIIVFRISAVSPGLHALVCLSQTMAAPIQVRILLLSTKYTSPVLSALTKIIVSLYGIWNLDFFRSLLPSVCLHLTTMQVLSLDYLIAVSPMILMIISYVLVELHSCGCTPLLYLCKPLLYVSARFRRRWDIQTSLVDAFATFFILSSTKLFSVSFDLISPTTLYTVTGERLGTYLYADPNLEYMTKHSGHLYYSLLSFTVLLLFAIFPLTLLLFNNYSCFKHFSRLKVVKEFLYTFQKYYKDGTGGTKDCRWYAALHHLSLLGIYILHSLARSEFSYILAPMYFFLFAVIVLLVEPYKNDWAAYNYIDCVLYLWQALFTVSITLLNFSSYLQRGYMLLGYTSILFVSISPLVLATALVLCWLLKLVGCECCIRRELQYHTSLPHRIVHSQEYKNVLA